MDGEESAEQEPEDALDKVVDHDCPGPEGHVGDVGDPGGEVLVHEPLRRLLGLPEGQVSQRVGHDEVAVEGVRVRKYFRETNGEEKIKYFCKTHKLFQRENTLNMFYKRWLIRDYRQILENVKR